MAARPGPSRSERTADSCSRRDRTASSWLVLQFGRVASSLGCLDLTNCQTPEAKPVPDAFVEEIQQQFRYYLDRTHGERDIEALCERIHKKSGG